MARFPAGQPGRPFGAEYDDRLYRPGAPRAVAAFARRGGPRPPGREYLDALRDELRTDDDVDAAVRARREAVVDRLVAGHALRGVEVDVRSNLHRSDVFPVVGELLMTPSTWADVQDEARSAGLEEVDLEHPELAGRLVRTRTRDARRARRLDSLVRTWRARGHVVSHAYVTPLGGRPIMKPMSGAFTPQVTEFPAYAGAGPRHGEGVVVAVVDTGITAERRGDGWLEGVERVLVDDPAGHGDESNVDPLDAEPADGFLDVYAGHGTFVAGIVAQVAPGATIRAYRAVGPGGAGSELDVACALVRAVREGAHVVNLSLGTQSMYDEPSLPLAAALDVVREIEDEEGRKVVVVAAAGNYGDDAPTWPAAFGRVVAVGGLTADLTPAPWSSRGSWVDLSAVAEGVLSTFVRGRQNPAFSVDAQEFGADAFAHWVGTSFAAPQVAGAVARTMTELGVDGPGAVDALLAAGKPVAGLGRALRILPGA